MTKPAVINITQMWQTTSTPVASELARAGLRSNPKKVAEALPERAQSPGQGHYVLERQPGPAGAISLATKAVSMRNCSLCDLLFVASELARAGLRSNPKKVAEALPERAQSPGQGHYVLERQPGPAGAISLATKAVSMRNCSLCDLLFVASELARAGLRSNPKKVVEALPERPQSPGQGHYVPQREQVPSPRRQCPCAIVASAICRLAL
ncbi:hypothetical protein C1886_18870 [Pseudomonas sp. FW300-N1A1]|nr:hypothetical protein C1886_18870 [Pseudomonas sp. FW300-N1A1]